MYRFLLIICVLGLSSCNYEMSEEQRNAINSEKDSRKIKRILPGEMSEKALLIAKEWQLAMKDNPDSVLLQAKEDGIGLNYFQHTSESDSVSKLYFDMYQYSIEQKIPVQPALQTQETFFAYSIPIIEADTLNGVWVYTFPKKYIISKM